MMGIVAWLRYSSKSDDYRLAWLRVLAPPSAVLVLFAIVANIHALLIGQSLATPSGGLLVGASVMFALSAAYTIFAVREHHNKTRGRQHGGKRRLDR